MYGADVEGSIFDEDVEVSLSRSDRANRQQIWNVSKLGTLLDVMKESGNRIMGVNSAYLYFGMSRLAMLWTLTCYRRNVESRILLAH